MSILVVGLSHHTAPVDVRDRVAFTAQNLGRALSGFREDSDVRECVILSTCNRSEIYVVADDPETASDKVIARLCDFHGQPRTELEGHLFFLREGEAVRHVFRVAAGLDSMIVGEPQIGGQVKDAHAAALNSEAAGVVLNRLFQMAAETSKRARTETEIGAGAVSVPYAAVGLAKKILGDLKSHTALVIGAGEMSELTARHLVANGIRSLRVTSRTTERARELSDRIGAEAVAFGGALERLHEVDVVISSTGAPHPILRRDAVVEAMQRRRNDPMFLIDIAVPRDIEPEVGSLYNVFLYNIDDLQSVVGINLAKREREASKVNTIIEEQAKAFSSWLNSLDVKPTIVTLREQFEAIMKAELARVKLTGFSEEQQQKVHSLLRGFANKLLHDPVTRLKEAADAGDGMLHVHAIRHLFGLGEEGGGRKMQNERCKMKNEKGKTDDRDGGDGR